eukprot:CAMPEP_0181101302 /NCGR_PEP_ID=MMETSP1071-20121207/13677_1 /TAXON_ID=35127 /ORGANISM="Thalassiosira sp., Strain NH16" /LENGTH=436 /DNA_ID=CAMNT_0023184135 /DNA_START=157 /DNA_END=1467 /DNA_ORIENTATION=-
MESREEFAAFMRFEQQQADGGGARTRQQQFRPPHAPKSGEQAPFLLPPMPQSALPPPGAISQQPTRPMGHGRSRSDIMTLAPPQSDPSHPFNRTGPSHPLPTPPGANRQNRPPRAGAPHVMVPPLPPQMGQVVLSPLSFGSPQAPDGRAPTRKQIAHRRAKSDIPLNLLGSNGSVASGGRILTKADLLKNLPSPRWGGAPKPLTHSRNRSRTGSDGLFQPNRSRTGSDGQFQPLLSDTASISSGGYGYGATSDSGAGGHPLLQSIGSVELRPDAKRPSILHKRCMSDASIKSVTTDLAKSALFKGVTDTGRIQLQLPKDSFRILLDSQLEAGSVYKRKLVDSEDDFFVEFHTVDDSGDPLDASHEKQKRLPPDLYVMAVDSTIYRRMLDEVIASRSMPCGTFFCGHHEDVRHPDITIAALIVSLVILLLLAATVLS